MIVFRGVKIETIESGKALTPHGTIVSAPTYMGHGFYGDGTKLGKCVTNAAIPHQRDSQRYPRGFVSFSRSFDVAKGYALSNGVTEGVVIEVDTDRFEKHSIMHSDVKDRVRRPFKPTDEEVLVWMEDGTALPEQIVRKLHHVFND
jgi:hypothetical protein